MKKNMIKDVLIKRMKNYLNNMALPAVLYAEKLIGNGFGQTKKRVAVDFIIEGLPIFLYPFKGVIKRLILDLFDFVIEAAVKKLQLIQEKIPQAL